MRWRNALESYMRAAGVRLEELESTEQLEEQLESGWIRGWDFVPAGDAGKRVGGRTGDYRRAAGKCVAGVQRAGAAGLECTCSKCRGISLSRYPGVAVARRIVPSLL